MNTKDRTGILLKSDLVITCIVFLWVVGMKLWYQTASIDNLRWIVEPTVKAVEWTSGTCFDFTPGLGFFSIDRTLLINKDCSGLNFLIMVTAFSVFIRFSREDSLLAKKTGWLLIPGLSFLFTLLANTTRIRLSMLIVSLQDDRWPWLSSASFHRVEGIFVYLFFVIFYYILFRGSDHEKTPTDK